MQLEVEIVMYTVLTDVRILDGEAAVRNKSENDKKKSNHAGNQVTPGNSYTQVWTLSCHYGWFGVVVS